MDQENIDNLEMAKEITSDDCSQTNIPRTKEDDYFEPPTDLWCDPSKISHQSITLRWTPPQDHKGECKFYRISCDKTDENLKPHHMEAAEQGTFITFNGLAPATKYDFTIRAIYEAGESAACTITSHTRPASEPGQPTLTQLSPIMAYIQWEPPHTLVEGSTIDRYEILAKQEDKEQWDLLIEVKGYKTKVSTVVIPNEPARYMIVANCGSLGCSRPSLESDVFCIKANPSDILKANICRKSRIIERGTPFTIFQPKITFHSSGKMKKAEIGSPKPGDRNFVIMVVGATGSGKTTLINGMINYIFGVEWNDNFRFKLVAEPQGANQARSQTNCLTAYVLHHQPEFKVPYTLTIIDTPGFGDTSGILRDKQITDDIRSFFHAGGDNGVDHIDAVGFVAQSSLPRLTHTQRYIFDQILSLFGKDIGENIFLMLTFADAQKPQVLSGLKEAKMPYQKFFKFNNSALYASNVSEKGQLHPTMDVDFDEDDEEDGNCAFDQMFWDMGAKSFETFFKCLSRVDSKSLFLTKDVLKERQQLEVYVEGIQQDITLGLNKLEQLQVEIDVVRRHQADIDKNKDFEYVVEQDKVEAVTVGRGTYVTNCTRCNRTCHDSCAYANDSDKINCCAMRNGYCTVCAGKCFWDLHRNMPYKYVLTREKVKKTSEELRQRYQQGLKDKMSAEKLIDGIDEDFCGLQLRVMEQSDEVRKSLERLQTIALRPSPLSTVGYIDLIIDSENAEARPGYQARVKQLRDVKAQVEYMQRVADKGFDPWLKYKKTMEEKKRENKSTSFWPKLGDLKIFGIFK